MKSLTVKTRLILLITCFTVLLAGVGFQGLNGIMANNGQLRSIYLNNTIPLSKISRIQDLMSDRVIQLSLATQNSGSNFDLPKQIQQTQHTIGKINKLWEDTISVPLTPEQKFLANEFTKLRQEFNNEGLIAVLDSLKKGQTAQASATLNQVLIPKYQLATEKLNDLVNLQIKLANEHYLKANDGFLFTVFVILLGALLVNAASLIFGCLMACKLDKQGKEELAAVKRMAAGDFSMNLLVMPGDNSSTAYHLNKLQKLLNEFVSAQDNMAQLHSAGFIYKSIKAQAFPGTFGTIAQQINDLVSSHIGLSMRMVDILGQYANGDFSANMERLPGEKSKITEALGNLKHSTLAIHSDLKTLCTAALQGDFSARADENRYQFIYKDTLAHFNHLLQACDTVFSDLQRVSRALAEGNLTETMTGDYPGVFGQVKTQVNAMFVNLENLVSILQEHANTVEARSNELMVGNSELSQRNQEQVISLGKAASCLQDLLAELQIQNNNPKQAKVVAQITDKAALATKQIISTITAINATSQKIADNMALIDDLALQTHMLTDNITGSAPQQAPMADAAEERQHAAANVSQNLPGDVAENISSAELTRHATESMGNMVRSIQDVAALVSEISSTALEQSMEINPNPAIDDETTQAQGPAGLGHAQCTDQATQEPLPDPDKPTPTIRHYTLESKQALVSKPRIKLIDNSEWDEF